jgi:dTDP-4-dehydrorhamnose reductase
MRTVLVTGAAGMLGREVVESMRGAYDVVGVDVDDFDVTDAAAVGEAIARISPDVIVNCAAYTDVDGAEAHREEAFAVNAAGAGHIARAAAEGGASLIHLSTDYVFDGAKGAPYTEDDPVGPLSVYGLSKLEGERTVQASGARSHIVRTAWLYGRSGRNFVDTVLRLAREGRALPIVDDQVGSPTSARDLATVIKELVARGALGIVNATNSGSASWYDFAVEILAVAGFESVTVEPIATSGLRRAAVRPPYSVLSLERLTGILGWTPRPWQEALREHLSER